MRSSSVERIRSRSGSGEIGALSLHAPLDRALSRTTDRLRAEEMRRVDREDLRSQVDADLSGCIE
jgi:hypothetical protein